MRVLWLCNIIPPSMAEVLGLEKPVVGGWISGGLKATQTMGEIEVAVCFPQEISKEMLVGKNKKILYYGFPASSKKPGKYDSKLEKWFREIIEDYQPNIVHIWGTEFSHSMAMAKVFNCPEKTICNIQGVCSAIAEHYCLGLPLSVVYGCTLRDLVRGDNTWLQTRRFMQRGNIEKQTLQKVGHVIGRTEFDKTCTKAASPAVKYHYCGETLRDEFYTAQNSWTYEKCEKYSIFVSSSDYPIKGFHQVLRAMPSILKRFPDAKVYVAGEDPRRLPFYRMTKYYAYIKKQIEKLELDDRIIYLGKLDEKAMCNRFLKSNVFVLASSIENSPNSVGEAMMLGMPIVASYVGGTMDMVVHKKEGFLYQSDASYMLAEYVCRLFEDDKLASQLGKNANEHALQMYDKKYNADLLKNIYTKVNETTKG